MLKTSITRKGVFLLSLNFVILALILVSCQKDLPVQDETEKSSSLGKLKTEEVNYWPVISNESQAIGMLTSFLSEMKNYRNNGNPMPDKDLSTAIWQIENGLNYDFREPGYYNDDEVTTVETQFTITGTNEKGIPVIKGSEISNWYDNVLSPAAKHIINNRKYCYCDINVDEIKDNKATVSLRLIYSRWNYFKVLSYGQDPELISSGISKPVIPGTAIMPNSAEEMIASKLNPYQYGETKAGELGYLYIDQGLGSWWLKFPSNTNPNHGPSPSSPNAVLYHRYDTYQTIYLDAGVMNDYLRRYVQELQLCYQWFNTGNPDFFPSRFYPWCGTNILSPTTTIYEWPKVFHTLYYSVGYRIKVPLSTYMNYPPLGFDYTKY